MTAGPEPADGQTTDAAGRERIRTSLGESLLVEAAAGTGKTTVLVQRLVAALGAETGPDGRPPDASRVVAVTFTRKAAGELKLRLRLELDRARGAATDDAVRARLDDAISRLEEAHIGTIHSFCAEILRQRPVEAAIDPAFQEMDDGESAALYERAFQGWIEGKLEEMPEALARGLARLAAKPRFDGASPVEQLRRAGRDLADWRDFDAPWRRDPFQRDLALNTLVDRLGALAEMAKQGVPRDPLHQALEPVVQLATWIERSEEASGRRDFDEIEALLVELLRDLRRQKARFGRSVDYAPGLRRRDVIEARDGLLEELEDVVRRADADLAAGLRLELRQVIDDYEALKHATGRLDFLDLLVRCRDLLRDRADVRAYFQERFSVLFVDEFQDTDPLQAEILLLLSADDPGESDWMRVRPVPGKLFLVGDPKQSIYRFRRADVVLYQRLQARLTAAGAGLVQLGRSFRATAPLQEAVNAAFAGAFAEDTGAGQPDYVALEGGRDPEPGQPSLVALPVPEPFGYWGRPTGRQIEASLPEAAAAYLDWMVRESGWTVDDPENPGARVPIRWRHVCILFRRFQSFGRDVSDPYLRELEAREVPHLLVGGRSLHQREELETLRVALAAVEWPDDALSVYGTLRGDLFGLTDGQLLRFRARAGHLDPFRRRPGDLADDFSPVAEALDLLADLHRRRNDVPIAHTLHRLLETTRAHAGFALRHSGNQVLANVQRLADMARAFEVGGGLSFRGFVERLDAEAEHPTAKHTPALEEGAEGVRLMTVHAAKGLEFPVVLLADPTCNLGVREPWRTFDGERRLAATKILGCPPQELLEARDLELERDRAEAVRLTYVAATRARELLVVPAVGTGPWRGGWLEPLYGAVYPPSAAYRRAEPAPGCPAMGETTVLQPPRDPRVDVPIRPGLHRPKEGTHGVVWWDPALLRLKVAGKFGLIKERVLRPDPEGDADARGLDAYVDWLDRRDQAVEAGQVASAEVATVTDFEQAPPEPAVEVTVEILGRPPGRPAGRRFGTLVHAILGDIDLAADTETVRDLAHLHGRMASAPEAEIDAAAEAVDAALRHPLLQKAAKAEDLWRETPFQLVLDGGLRLEGTFDLAFGDGDTWTVVDFKTDAGLGEATHLDRYRRQVAWYAHALRELTGRPAEAVLLGV